MGVFDVTTPAGNQAKSLGDDRIRELKVGLLEMFRGGAADGVEAVAPGSAPLTAPIFRYRGLKGTTGARPTSGQGGLYINTTLSTLQRDNGVSWDDVATLLPAGTKMVFYQASAPTGWTAVAVNDMFLRVVTAGGTGGSTGGTVAASATLAHTHTIAHTHDLANHTHSTPDHQHQWDYTSVNSTTVTDTGVTSKLRTLESAGDGATPNASGTTVQPAGSFTRLFKAQTQNSGSGTSGTPSSNTSGASSASDSGSTFAGAFQRADVIIATRD